MKKLLGVSLVLMMMAMGSQTFAEEEMNDREAMKAKKMEMKMEMKEMKSDAMADVKANRDAMEQNRMDFREDHKDEAKEVFASVDEDIKSEIKALHAETKAKLAELKENYQDGDDREALLEEMKSLHEAQAEKVKELLADNLEALELVEKRKAVFEQNMELRKENRETRKEYRGERSEMVSKYKGAFISRIGNKLDKIPSDKLEKVLERIDAMEEKYEANEKISDERKDKIISQLLALKEMIEEKLEQDAAEEDILDMEALLSE